MIRSTSKTNAVRVYGREQNKVTVIVGRAFIINPDKEIKEVSDNTYLLLETDKQYRLNFTNPLGCLVTVPDGLPLGNRYEGKDLTNNNLKFVGETGVSIDTYELFEKETAGKFSPWALDCEGINMYTLFGTLKI